MAPRIQSPLLAVFGIIAILIGFVVFVLTYGDLSRKLWIQGLVGVIVALLISVVLFTIVYSTAHVKGAAWLGGVLGISGGALFYLLLLPQIKPFFFPTHSVSGYVYFKNENASEPLTPVSGVTAEIPGTGQKSAPTDNSGRFTIDNVYTENTKLQFQYATKVYPVDTTAYPENRYPIILRPQKEPAPNKKPVATQWTRQTAHNCEVQTDQGYRQVTGFVLQTDLARDPEEQSRDAKLVHLKVSLPAGFGDLTQPADLNPGNSIDFLELGDVEGRSQGWEWSRVSQNQLAVKVAICVNRKAGEREPAPSDLQTVYWFGIWR